MEGSQQFIEVVMPERFVLEVPAERGGWVDYGFYESKFFARLPDGSYVCAGHGGSPLFLRCVRQSGQEIEVLDGEGDHYVYRLVPYPAYDHQSAPEDGGNTPAS